MEITLQSHSEYSPIGPMAFSANWQDDTHRYHVWIGIRPDVEGERPPYPVRIDKTIYKNKIDDRRANTIKMDIDATKNAKIKAEIKRIAIYDTLMMIFNARWAEIKAFDTMRAEADRLNRIYDALATVRNASAEDLELFA